MFKLEMLFSVMNVYALNWQLQRVPVLNSTDSDGEGA